jgi:hypothetical protein
VALKSPSLRADRAFAGAQEVAAGAIHHRHSLMVRQHQTSDAQLRIGNLEIPGARLRIAP